MTTNYEKIRSEIKKNAGRKPLELEVEEKKRREEARKLEMYRRAEARRRAHAVLQFRYGNEFKELFAEEYTNLATDKRFSNQ